MRINSVRHLKNLKNKTVFLRVDFNVPLKDGRVRDDYRLLAGLETIKFLLAKNCRLIVATHLGEPPGEVTAGYSVKPVAARLKIILGQPVKFLPNAVGAKVQAAVKKMKPGDIVMLENLRFHRDEYNDDARFAKELAALADVYVNDAFSVCHRKQASVAAIKKYLPSYAGLLLEKEVNALNRIKQPKKPLVVIMGGAKIGTKAPLITKLYPRADHILLGGALANNFFKFQNKEIGRSLCDADSTIYVRQFFKNKKLAAKIILPLDVVVQTKKGEAEWRRPEEVGRQEYIFDIGPNTISLYAQYIKKANTLVWNGPLGKFEMAGFKQGTLSVARLVAARSSGPAYGVVGGGETVEALQLTKMAEYVDWVSTAGGAMLTYLGGGKMPGLMGIIKK
jgi:phosphoglycerate kinase